MLPAISLENQFGVRLHAARPGLGQNAVTDAAQAALDALNADPNYCSSVAVVGSAVNSAVHNFKLQWNAAYPSEPVPINTGNYEQSVADALSNTLNTTVPTGCAARTGPVGPVGPVGPPGPGPGPGPSPAPPSSNTFFFGWPLWEQALAVAAAAGAAVLGTTALMKTGPGKKVAGHARRIHGRAVHHARRMTHRLRGKHA